MVVREEVHRSTTVSKALACLRLFLDKELLSLQDVEKELGYTKTSAYAMVSTMVDSGFLLKDELTKRYYLGPILFTLARMYQDEDIIKISHSFLEELVDVLGETAAISRRIRHKVIILDGVESSNYIRWSGNIHETLNHLYLGSNKVHLAYMSPAEVEKYLQKTELISLTPHTITDRNLLLEHLSRIRERGYLVSGPEVDSEVVSVSAPIWGRGKEPLLGLRVIGPLSRITPERYEEFIKSTVEYANKISKALLQK